MERPGGYDLSADDVRGEDIQPHVAGYLEISRSDARNAEDIFNDKRRLKGRLRKIVRLLHDDGKEIWARVNAHKGLVITVVSSAAVAAGMVGIGKKVRGKGERKK